jgi:disulfide oxidoreductase YuzD
MSIDMRVPSNNEMREFVNGYLKSRYPKSNFDNEVFDDETIQDMFTEVNSKYWEA